MEANQEGGPRVWKWGGRAESAPRPSARRSGAVPTWVLAHYSWVSPAAAGCAADPPGSAELGSCSSPRAPTSSPPGARVRAGRRRPRHLEGGRERRWGRSWESEEGRRGGRAKRRRGWRRPAAASASPASPQARARAQEGALHLQVFRSAGCWALACPVCLIRKMDRSPAAQFAVELETLVSEHLLPFATSCLTVLGNPRLEHDFLPGSAYPNPAHRTFGA